MSVTSIAWTAQPAVAALLARCVAEPPREVFHRATYVVTTDEWAVYDSAPVRALRRLYEAAADAALARRDAGDLNSHAALDAADPLKALGHRAVPKRFWLSPPVDRMVFAAIATAAGELERAA